MKFLRSACLFVFLGLFAGCGTLVSLPGMKPYGGVQKNYRTADSRLSATSEKFVSCADMPLSFVLDTILLPVTIPMWLGSSSDTVLADASLHSPSLAFDPAGSGELYASR